MLSIQGKTSTCKPHSSCIYTSKFPFCARVYRKHIQEAVGAQEQHVAKGAELNTKRMHSRQIILIF